MSTNDGFRVPEREAQREIWRAKKELLELTDPDREDAFDAERETCECMPCAWRRRWGERERAEFAAFEAEHPDELKKLQRRRDWYLRVPRTWFPLDDLDERADAERDTCQCIVCVQLRAWQRSYKLEREIKYMEIDLERRRHEFFERKDAEDEAEARS